MESGVRARFWLCQGCGRHVPARLDQCRCGYARDAAEAALVEPAGADAEDGPVWYAVGPAKLVVMSVATLGLYQVYWFYRHWRAVRDAGEDVRPLPRSIFGALFCYALFRRVARSAGRIGSAGWDPALLAAVYIVLCLSAQLLPFPYALAAVLSVLPLAAVQRTANACARHDFPQEAPDTRFTALNWAGIALGCAFFGLLGYGALQRQKATSLEFLSAVAAEANRTPREAQNGILLERVEAEEGRLIYRFALSEEARARIEERRPLLKANVTPGVCADRLLKLGAAVRFVYRGPNGEDVATVDVSPQDCSWAGWR